MTILKNWWHSKNTTQKNKWRLLALLLCIISSGFVEARTWAALIGVLPSVVLIYLEITAENGA